MFKNLKRAVIEITTRCNINCVGCYRFQQKNFKVKDMDFEVFQNVIDQLPVNIPVALFMNGDPLCNTRFVDFVKYAMIHHPVCISTNGMNSAMSIQFLAIHCSQLVFSIDGDRKSTSEMYRPGTKYETVIDNIYYAIGTKKTHGLSCDICVRLTHRGQEWGEVEDFVSKWIKAGADMVMVGKEIHFGNRTLNERAYSCKFLEGEYIVVDVDGKMIICERAGDNKIVIGDTKKQSLEKLYDKGLKLKPKYCKHCSCGYSGDGFRGMIMVNGRMLNYKEDYFQRIFMTRSSMNLVK